MSHFYKCCKKKEILKIVFVFGINLCLKKLDFNKIKKNDIDPIKL